MPSREFPFDTGLIFLVAALFSIPAVFAGGYGELRLGVQWRMPKTLVRLLAAALVVAGLKYLFT